MTETFEQYILRVMPGITKEQTDLLLSKCIVRKLHKKEILLKEGGISHYKIFVMKGLLRNYNIAENGNETIVRFTDEGEWTTDPESYFSGLPSKYNIDAIEPTEVVLIHQDDLLALKQQVPPFALFMVKMMTDNANLIQKRVLMSISGSAEEKYLDFIQSYPSIFKRVPLHMIASYLGLSRETLTRVRQGLANK